jgi:hypothetical protein
MGNIGLERTFFITSECFFRLVSVFSPFISRSSAYALLIGWLYLEKTEKLIKFVKIILNVTAKETKAFIGFI